MRISPSIASADPLRWREALCAVEQGGYRDLHIDIEDGNFIPNITFGMKAVRAFRRVTALPFSFHLMVNRPSTYLEDISEMGASIVFAHVEALDYPSDFLALARKAGLRAGLAFNPKTSPEPLLYLADRLDGVLVLTAEPDGRGQEFLPVMIAKVRMSTRLFPAAEIWVDGDLSRDCLEEMERAGATVAVMGRAVFGYS
ncbi:hypothetical protein [Aminiphilus circumscriptus]|jgi:ribulose-phosphate 3-epimerase|uniref:hypothetical protein n=1 Tax=Aminiphilus circumscriptus TaxID=290732 RepID=UPI0004785D8C|nr:hypothetical protein [Aminiphilus circumscriptus]